MMRSCVVGDVHGCYDELVELLDKVDCSRVVFAGDLLDKGPRSADCVRLVRKYGFESILGNHEESYLRYHRHEQRKAADPSYKNPMRFNEEKRAIYAQLSEDDFSWLAARSKSLEIRPNVWLVHGGLLPKQHPKDAGNESLRIRWINEASGKMTPLPADGDLWNPPEGSVWWPKAYEGAEPHSNEGLAILYGHAVRSFTSPKYEWALPHVTIGIDTGCVYGGRLTAAVIDDDSPYYPMPEFVSVKAKQAYKAPPPGWPHEDSYI